MLCNNPPYFLHTLPYWVFTHSTYMFKLCTLQNKAIKFIRDVKKSNHVTSYYYELNHDPQQRSATYIYLDIYNKYTSIYIAATWLQKVLNIKK